jgi:hypothetical protein
MNWPKGWTWAQRADHLASIAWRTGRFPERPREVSDALGRWFGAIAAQGRRVHRIALRRDLYLALGYEITATSLRAPEPGEVIKFWAPWGPVLVVERP